MMNFRNSKTKRIIVGVVAILIVLAMVVPMILSAVV